LRALLQRVDTTLVQEWETLLAAPDGDAATAGGGAGFDVVHDPKALRARIRAELHLLVKALAERDYVEATSLVRDSVEEPWTEERFEQALAPFYTEHERIIFDHASRFADKTQLSEDSPGVYQVRQILVDETGDNHWYIAGEVDARSSLTSDEPLLTLREIRG
jgi:hypothetical protein